MITLMIMAPMIRADDVEGGSTLHLKGKGLTLILCFVLINVLGVNILGVYLISTVLHCDCLSWSNHNCIAPFLIQSILFQSSHP